MLFGISPAVLTSLIQALDIISIMGIVIVAVWVVGDMLEPWPILEQQNRAKTRKKIACCTGAILLIPLLILGNIALINSRRAFGRDVKKDLTGEYNISHSQVSAARERIRFQIDASGSIFTCSSKVKKLRGRYGLVQPVKCETKLTVPKRRK